MKKKFSAFTLAEVLITLGVIGVIAAMTVPTLNDGIAAAKNKAQFKKTFATVAQAGKMAAQNDVDFSNAGGACGSSDYIEKYSTMCAIFNNALSGATKGSSGSGDTRSYKSITKNTVSTALTNVTSGSIVSYELLDGSWIVFPETARSNCTLGPGGSVSNLNKSCFGFIDTNGMAPPNREVRCSNGTAKVTSSAGGCDVRNNTTDMGDIFPIVFHDNVVEPATNAAKYVLTHK